MPDRNFANRTLYHGDNLDFLRGMNSGTVNLIATDPPFNKSRDFHATPNSLAKGASFQDRWSWQDDIHDDWLIAIMRYEPEVWHVITTAKEVWGDDMGAFLCWLGVRLLEMHRILADDGSLYLHIDHTAHAWVKCLLDAVFGRHNFRNEIVWCYGGRGMAKQWFQKKHDTILFYSKSDSYFFSTERASRPVAPEHVGRYNKIDDEGRRYARIKNRDASYSNIYLKDVVREDWWNIPYARGNEATGYPTQKPLALYERIIQASSNPGDLVLDPFAGCATTPVAAERLGRQWVGMDIWDGAHQIVLDRLAAEGLAVKSRPRRGGQQTLTLGDITYSTTPPKRTDGGETVALILRTPTGSSGQRYPPPRTQHGKLLMDIGPFCQGCGADYAFDTRVLEVDHINPRSQGGTDSYENLTLLCPPCNKEKRDRFTLVGLQQHNRANGYMRNESNLRMGRVAGRSSQRRRR